MDMGYCIIICGTWSNRYSTVSTFLLSIYIILFLVHLLILSTLSKRSYICVLWGYLFASFYDFWTVIVFHFILEPRLTKRVNLQNIKIMDPVWSFQAPNQMYTICRDIGILEHGCVLFHTPCTLKTTFNLFKWTSFF